MNKLIDLLSKKQYLLGWFFSILGFIYVLLVTIQYNIGVGIDSVSYLEGARNICSGNGYTTRSPLNEFSLITHWPPLYSACIAFTSLITHLDCLDAVKYLSAILLGLTILLSNIILNKFQSNIFLKIIFNLLLLTSYAFQGYLILQSESLFILLIIIQLYFLITFLETKNNRYLIIASLFLGFSILTRFAGVGLMLGVVLFFFLQKEKLTNKITTIFIYGSIATCIVASWIIFASLHSSNASDRSFIFHLITLHHLERLGGTIIHWISPSFTFIIGPIVIIYFLVLFLLNRKKFINYGVFTNDKVKLFIFLIISYLGFLFITINLFDFSTTFDSRMLSPIFPFLLIVFVAYLNKVNSIKIYIIPVLLMIFSSIYGFTKSSLEFYNNGSSYNGKMWSSSEILHSLKENSTTKTIFTNGSNAIKFSLGKSEAIYSIPFYVNPNTQVINKNLRKELESIKVDLKSKNGMVIYFYDIKMYFLPDDKFLMKEFESFHILRFNDGIIIE